MAKVGSYTHPFMYEKSYKHLGRAFIPNMVLILTLASFIPMLLVSGLVLDQFSISHKEKIYAHLKEVVQKHTLDIDSFLNERLKNIQFLSHNCDIQDLSNDSFLGKKLAQLQRTYGDVFEDLGVINEKGVQKYYAGRFKLEQAQYADARWFNKAIERQTYISDVFSGLRSSPHFIVSVKHVCEGKTYLLRATINFDAFTSLAENLRIGKTGYAFILNKAGEFQTKPHFDMLPSKKSYPDFVKAGTQTKQGTYIGTLKDAQGKGDVIFVATLLKNDDWILVFQQEKLEAFAKVINAQMTTGVVIFMGALLIVLANLILFRKVLSRISEAEQEKEMMNRQVIESGKLASVGELAAGIAHEINNPVAIMVQEAGWIEDLLEEEEFQETNNIEEFRRALKQVHTQGNRCKDITHKLLSFARKTSPKIEKIMINDIIREVVAITNLAAYTNISMQTHLDETLPPIFGSQTEAQQVFLNLINNALHALEKEGGHIDISSRIDQEDIVLTVQDDGPGIPEANLSRIFDPFFTTKPVGRGAGLGLSICFGIIKKMGGDIDVYSAIEEGARFEIRFPIENEKAAKFKDLTPLNAMDAEAFQRESKNTFKKRVELLLVDDEQRFVQVLKKRLSRRNISVKTALSGSEGIQALRKVDFDVAILDLKMEDMDGLDVLKIFKTMYPQMEVIILSGHESAKAAREGMHHGAFAYLAKPCNFEDLINTIRNAVKA